MQLRDWIKNWQSAGTEPAEAEAIHSNIHAEEPFRQFRLLIFRVYLIIPQFSIIYLWGLNTPTHQRPFPLALSVFLSLLLSFLSYTKGSAFNASN